MNIIEFGEDNKFFLDTENNKGEIFFDTILSE